MSRVCFTVRMSEGAVRERFLDTGEFASREVSLSISAKNDMHRGQRERLWDMLRHEYNLEEIEHHQPDLEIEIEHLEFNSWDTLEQDILSWLEGGTQRE